MEREQVNSLKERFKPVLERGRRMFGKETYDNHIRRLLEHFGYNIEEDKDIKEIFGI